MFTDLHTPIALVAFLFMFLPPLILAYSIFKKSQYIIFLSIILFIIGKFLFNGWMDGLVAVYFSFSAFLFYILIIVDQNSYKKSNILYYVAFCFFTILTLIKNEGVVLLLILFIFGILFKIFTNNLKKEIYLLFFLSLSFLPIIAWKLFCFYNEIGYTEYYNINILSNLLPRLYELKNYQLVSYFLLLNEKFLISLLFFYFLFGLTRKSSYLVMLLF